MRYGNFKFVQINMKHLLYIQIHDISKGQRRYDYGVKGSVS